MLVRTITPDWREAEANAHEAKAEACTTAITALLDVADAIGPDFTITNALVRLERERSELERQVERIRVGSKIGNGLEGLS